MVPGRALKIRHQGFEKPGVLCEKRLSCVTDVSCICKAKRYNLYITRFDIIHCHTKMSTLRLHVLYYSTIILIMTLLQICTGHVNSLNCVFRLRQFGIFPYYFCFRGIDWKCIGAFGMCVSNGFITADCDIWSLACLQSALCKVNKQTIQQFCITCITMSTRVHYGSNITNNWFLYFDILHSLTCRYRTINYDIHYLGCPPA